MSRPSRRGAAALLALAAATCAAGCTKLAGLTEQPTPLGRIQLKVTGDFAAVRLPSTRTETARLRVALAWGGQWQPEPFCVEPPESDAAAAVIAAGCPDSFRFVPLRVNANLDVQPGVPATIDLMSVPTVDLMVGDLTGRVAYASLVAYDDRNHSGTLELRRAARNATPAGDGGVPDAGVDAGADAGVDAGGDAGAAPRSADIVYGASFISMTLPDQRVAYLEGTFDAAAAFYPRHGCPAPAPGYSVLTAGGFSATAALEAAAAGKLPDEDPARCSQAPLTDAEIVIPLQPPDAVSSVACTASSGGTTTYRKPGTAPDLTQRAWACIKVPGSSGGAAAAQLVVASAPGDACKGVAHYVLTGCSNGPPCTGTSTQWDLSADDKLLAWWPCKGATP
jgi:hypothetical protein